MTRIVSGGTLAVCSLFGIIGTAAGAQQVDTVRVGSPALRAASLPLGTIAMESFRRADGVDTPISTTLRRITASTRAGEQLYTIHTTHTSIDGDTTEGMIVVRARDFALVHQRVKATRDSAAVTANAGHLTGWVVLPDEPLRLLDQRLERPVFPIEGQIPWLFPLLPLADGYAATIAHFSPWEGGEEWTTIRVIGSERRESGGVAHDCWRVDGGELFPGFRATYWVDKQTRRLVEGEARGADPEPVFWSRVRAQ